MDKQHFDQLIKGVREMQRHLAGKSVRGAKVTELLEPDVRSIRKIDRCEPAHIAELGATAHQADWSRQGAAQDRSIGPESAYGAA